jgi:hypothetical protein
MREHYFIDLYPDGYPQKEVACVACGLNYRFLGYERWCKKSTKDHVELANEQVLVDGTELRKRVKSKEEQDGTTGRNS